MSYRSPFCLLLILLSACSGSKEGAHSGGMRDASGKNFSDLYLEYVSPGARWAAPETFVLHVNASDGGKTQPFTAEASLSRAQFRGEEGTPTPPPPTFSVPTELAREQMRKVYAALPTKIPTGAACLYPVNIRLTTTEGTLLQRQGCRGQSPWLKAVYELTDQILARSDVATPSASHPETFSPEVRGSPAQPVLNTARLPASGGASLPDATPHRD